MYKSLRNFLMIVAGIAILVISISTFFVNRFMLTKFKEEYLAIKQDEIQYFLNENLKDLEDLIISHAVWTDTQEALINDDYNWLYDNATGYIIDDDNLNIDYLFIADENGNRSVRYGDISIDIQSIELYDRVIQEDMMSQQLIWLKGKPILLVGHPITDNEGESPFGSYILGRVLSTDEILVLSSLLSERYIKSISFDIKSIDDIPLKITEVAMSHKLADSDIYLNIVFNIDYFANITQIAIITTFSFIIIVASTAVFILTINIKKLTNGINRIISTVKDISKGNYHVKLDLDFSSKMPEINELMSAVNVLSSDIENQIEMVQTHSDTIDQQYINTIELLVTIVEMNDNYTYHHSVSVSDYALIIGKAIHYSELDDLELAAKLHDVGKISIATEILNKPGKLTSDEFEVIKTHSENGYKLLNKISKFEKAKIGVLYHHEKYNGQGYPKGLKEDEIPLIAQIIAVADTYDALTSDRAYRKAMSHEDAQVILLQEKGISLNPDLVDILLFELNKDKA